MAFSVFLMIPEIDSLAEIGYISRLHGYKGDLTLHVTLADPSEFEVPDTLYLFKNGEVKPYELLEFAMKTASTAKLSLEGVNTEDVAKSLVGSKVMILPEELPDQDRIRGEIRSMTGFDIIDATAGHIGQLTGLLDFPGNPLLQVDHNKKEVLIPLNEEMVTGTDLKKREIYVNLPEGLLDL